MHPLFKLKAKAQGGLIVNTRTPDDPEQKASAIEECAKDLIAAMESKDTKKVAEALTDAFSILDSLPHEEGPHENEDNSYASQNEKAGEE